MGIRVFLLRAFRDSGSRIKFAVEPRWELHNLRVPVAVVLVDNSQCKRIGS